MAVRRPPRVHRPTAEEISAVASRFLEITPDSVVITDRTGTIVAVNPAALKLFGYAESELIGQTVDILVPERFRREHVAQRHHYVADPRTRLMRSGHGHLARRKGGAELSVDVALAPWPPDGTILVAAILRDISGQNAVERVKDKIIEIVHHELRTPLTVIFGMNETLQRHDNNVDPDTRQQMYETISRRTADLMVIAEKLFTEIDRIVHQEWEEGPTSTRAERRAR